MAAKTRISHPLPPVTPAEESAHSVVAALCEAGFEALIVGGAVRDRLLERPVNDVDVATNATPDQVEALFDKTIAVGKSFGVIIVLRDEIQIEVATFRQDAEYSDGRHPDAVIFSSAVEDASRRDFTINALFYDPASEEIVDYVDGLSDLRRGVLRTIGEAEVRFKEDNLRMMRAIRFATRFNFDLDAGTATAIREYAEHITTVSAERLFSELTKMLCGPHPERAFNQMSDLGLLHYILPELDCMHGVKQPPQFHPEGDVWVHTMLLLAHMAHPDAALAWSVLLHDVGKPPTFEINTHGRESFPCHANVGADMAVEILHRLKASNQLVETVKTAVYYHMTFAEVKKMRTSTLRRLMGRESFGLELELHRIDCMACHGKLDNYSFLLDKIHEYENEVVLPPPLLNGRDVMDRGIPAGPAIGVILGEAEELQLNNEWPDRDSALVWLDRRITQEKEATE